jgi:hypothetical protein
MIRQRVEHAVTVQSDRWRSAQIVPIDAHHDMLASSNWTCLVGVLLEGAIDLDCMIWFRVVDLVHP